MPASMLLLLESWRRLGRAVDIGVAPRGRGEHQFPRRRSEFLRQALVCETREGRANGAACWSLPSRPIPTNVTARGLLGQVQVDGRWLTPEQAAADEQAGDEQAALLAEYEARRAAAPDTAAGQWKLALWCERHGLKAEATAHFTQVTRLDPTNRAAWLRLGCRWYQGRWVNEEQIAAEEAEIRSQKRGRSVLASRS